MDDSASVRATPTRLTLPDANEDKLFFAQVREDPRIELEALQVQAGETVVVVSSGGCTALSLLAAGAGHVVAVDLNAAQNHLVELKLAALSGLESGEAVAFLGGATATPAWRLTTYEHLSDQLSPFARAYWQARLSNVAGGVLNAGVSERFIGIIVAAIRLLVHPPSRIRRLLACRSVDEQRSFYEKEWNTRRWRLLFRVLLNRAVFRHTYDPGFFRHVENPSFARHFHELIGHVLADVPITDNYFVHQMLTGAYPQGEPDGLPPYLQPAGASVAGREGHRLTLVDGSYLGYLRSRPDSSIDAFALSNICEWLDAAQTDDLLAEVIRTAIPGARLVFRNFVGWTEVPPRWRKVIVEDRTRGEQLIAGDRSGMQRRVAVCRIFENDGP
ncbi:MAG: DUF3419 family protein [Acidimicrobiales bacterium]